MRLPTLLSSLLLAVAPFAAANPVANDDSNGANDWDGNDGHTPRTGCLSDHSAAMIVSKFEQLFVQINLDDAKSYLKKEFHVYSDSTNYATPNATHTVCSPFIFSFFPFRLPPFITSNQQKTPY